MFKKLLAFSIAIALLFAAAVCAVAAEGAAPIGKDDFIIKLAKGDFDLLTDEGARLRELTKLKWKLLKSKDETGIDLYRLAAKEATFFCWPDWEEGGIDKAEVIQQVTLTKKGVTARGIKIGSKLDALTAAYGEANAMDDNGYARKNGKPTTYFYRYWSASNSSEGGFPTLTEADREHLDEYRPDNYYEISFAVSAKTKKVTAITIAQCHAG